MDNILHIHIRCHLTLTCTLLTVHIIHTQDFKLKNYNNREIKNDQLQNQIRIDRNMISLRSHNLQNKKANNFIKNSSEQKKVCSQNEVKVQSKKAPSNKPL